jgi:Pyruvate/2-oxoacid:ferredoxin oxidoreductase gamma subunit
LFVNITVRWAIFLFGCIALLLGAVPYIAFFYGPRIRAHSKYSKILMEEERKRIGAEKGTADVVGAQRAGEKTTRRVELEEG